MPIEFSPSPGLHEIENVFCRRDFLRSVMAAGIVPRMVSSAVAELGVDGRGGSAGDPNVWALFADIHIAGDVTRAALGVNMAENFRAAIGEVLGRPRRAAGVLINGDCAFQTGQIGDYRVLCELLEPLRQNEMPVFLTLGNHDDRNHFRDAMSEVDRVSLMEQRHVGVIRTPRVNWILADSSTRPVSEGRFGAAQIEWMAAVLDAEPEKPAIIYAHHNPVDEIEEWPLQDTEEFFSMVAPRGQVKAYVFGHTHRWTVTQHASGIHLVNLPSSAYVLDAGEPSGWVEAEVLENGMTLELRCIGEHRLHGQRLALEWR
jgi:hypothetical protein